MSGITNASARARAEATQRAWLPTAHAYFAENYARQLAAANDFTQTTQVLQVYAGPHMYAGEVINGISVYNGSTASGTLTNAWACIIDPANLSVLAKGTDTGAVAWGGFEVKDLAFGTPFVMPRSFAPYIGILIKAGTMPTMRGVASYSELQKLAPRLTAKSTTGLTNPASLGATAATLTDSAGGSALPWIGVY